MPRDFVDCDCYNLDKSLLNENVRFHRKTLFALIFYSVTLETRWPRNHNTHTQAIMR